MALESGSSAADVYTYHHGNQTDEVANNQRINAHIAGVAIEKCNPATLSALHLGNTHNLKSNCSSHQQSAAEMTWLPQDVVPQLHLGEPPALRPCSATKTSVLYGHRGDQGEKVGL